MRARALLGWLGLATAALGCQSPAEQCNEQRDRAACEKACEEGHAGSCHRLARILDELEHVDPEIAMRAFERACELGSPFGCRSRASYCAGIGSDTRAATAEELACRQRFAEQACQLGDGLSCRQLEKIQERQARNEDKGSG